MAAGTGTVPIAGDLVIEDIVAVNSESVRLVVRLYDCRPNSATSKADKSIVEGHAVLDNAVPVISQRSNLWVANCYSSGYRELINPLAVRLPTEFIQLDGQFCHDASNFSRPIAVR